MLNPFSRKLMQAGTFFCNGCKIKFQLIRISTPKYPKYYPYCGKDSIQAQRNFWITGFTELNIAFH
jgi:hypothetical protein